MPSLRSAAILLVVAAAALQICTADSAVLSNTSAGATSVELRVNVTLQANVSIGGNVWFCVPASLALDGSPALSAAVGADVVTTTGVSATSGTDGCTNITASLSGRPSVNCSCSAVGSNETCSTSAQLALCSGGSLALLAAPGEELLLVASAWSNPLSARSLPDVSASVESTTATAAFSSGITAASFNAATVSFPVSRAGQARNATVSVTLGIALAGNGSLVLDLPAGTALSGTDAVVVTSTESPDRWAANATVQGATLTGEGIANGITVLRSPQLVIALATGANGSVPSATPSGTTLTVLLVDLRAPREEGTLGTFAARTQTASNASINAAPSVAASDASALARGALSVNSAALVNNVTAAAEGILFNITLENGLAVGDQLQLTVAPNFTANSGGSSAITGATTADGSVTGFLSVTGVTGGGGPSSTDSLVVVLNATDGVPRTAAWITFSITHILNPPRIGTFPVEAALTRAAASQAVIDEAGSGITSVTLIVDDITPPQVDGSGLGFAITGMLTKPSDPLLYTNTRALSFSFNAFSDPETAPGGAAATAGIGEYEYAVLRVKSELNARTLCNSAASIPDASLDIVVNFTGMGTATSFSQTVSALVDGAAHVVRIRASNRRSPPLQTTAQGDVCWMVDTTTPFFDIRDLTSTGGDDRNFTTDPSAWSGWWNYSAPFSGLEYMRWSLGLTPCSSGVCGEEIFRRANVTSFNEFGGTIGFSRTSLSPELFEGATLYLNIIARSWAGTEVKLNSDGFVIDSSPPESGAALVRHGAPGTLLTKQMSTSSIDVYWSGFRECQSDIFKYEWSIGVTGNPESVQPFSTAGIQTASDSDTITGSASGLSLTKFSRYIVTVRAVNTANLTASKVSAGIEIDVPDQFIENTALQPGSGISGSTTVTAGHSFTVVIAAAYASSQIAVVRGTCDGPIPAGDFRGFEFNVTDANGAVWSSPENYTFSCGSSIDQSAGSHTRTITFTVLRDGDFRVPLTLNNQLVGSGCGTATCSQNTLNLTAVPGLGTIAGTADALPGSVTPLSAAASAAADPLVSVLGGDIVFAEVGTFGSFNASSDILCHFGTNDNVTTGAVVAWNGTVAWVRCPVPPSPQLVHGATEFSMSTPVPGSSARAKALVSSTVTYACPPGYARRNGTGSCVACLPGTFSNATNAPECTSCPETHFQDQAKQSTCRPCPLHSTAFPGAITRGNCECHAGYYGDLAEDGRAFLEGCRACPALATCPVSGLLYPYQRAGFLLGERRNASLAHMETCECDTGESCVCTVPFITQCFPAVACPASPNTVVCAEGYRATVAGCDSCVAGAFRQARECRACPSSDASLVLLLVVLLGVALVAAPLIYRLTQFLDELRSGFGLLAQTVGFAQITALFRDIDLGWPSALDSLFSVLSSLNINLEVLQLECVFSGDVTFATKWTASMIFPVLLCLAGLMILGVQIYFIRRAIRTGRPLGRALRRFVGSTDAGAEHRLVSKAIRMAATFAALAYTWLAYTPLQIFSCVKNAGDGNWYMYDEPSIRCWEYGGGVWSRMFPWAVVGSVVYAIGAPGVLLWYMHRHRHDIDERTFRDRVGLLIRRYRPRFFYWEVIIMLRKFLFVAADRLNVDDTLRQIAISICVVLTAIFVHVYARPFTTRIEDKFEFVIVLSEFIVLFAGLLFFTERMSAGAEDGVQWFTLFLILGVISAAFILIFIDIGRLVLQKRFLRERERKYQVRFGTIFDMSSWLYVKRWLKYGHPERKQRREFFRICRALGAAVDLAEREEMGDDAKHKSLPPTTVKSQQQSDIKPSDVGDDISLSDRVLSSRHFAHSVDLSLISIASSVSGEAVSASKSSVDHDPRFHLVRLAIEELFKPPWRSAILEYCAQSDEKITKEAFVSEMIQLKRELSFFDELVRAAVVREMHGIHRENARAVLDSLFTFVKRRETEDAFLTRRTLESSRNVSEYFRSSIVRPIRVMLSSRTMDNHLLLHMSELMHDLAEISQNRRPGEPTLMDLFRDTVDDAVAEWLATDVDASIPMSRSEFLTAAANFARAHPEDSNEYVILKEASLVRLFNFRWRRAFVDWFAGSLSDVEREGIRALLKRLMAMAMQIDMSEVAMKRQRALGSGIFARPAFDSALEDIVDEFNEEMRNLASAEEPDRSHGDDAAAASSAPSSSSPSPPETASSEKGRISNVSDGSEGVRNAGADESGSGSAKSGLAGSSRGSMRKAASTVRRSGSSAIQQGMRSFTQAKRLSKRMSSRGSRSSMRQASNVSPKPLERERSDSDRTLSAGSPNLAEREDSSAPLQYVPRSRRAQEGNGARLAAAQHDVE